MFKGLLRTMPSLTGNFTLCCSINNLNRIDSNTFDCFIKTASMLPLQLNLYSKNINVDLLNGSYTNDVGRYYNEYKDYFYKDNFTFLKNNYQEYNKYGMNYNRNSSYEFGCSRLNINNYQFIFFAPFYFDDPNSLPDEFIIKISLGETVEKQIKIYINRESNFNILKYYLTKYGERLDNSFIYLSNNFNYGIYNGIDVKNGSLANYKNVNISKIFDSYISQYNINEIINKGYQDVNMICKQIIPLSFAFNVDDVLTQNELKYFSYSNIKISGYWVKNNINMPIYDFNLNYDINYSPNISSDFIMSNLNNIVNEQYDNSSKINIYSFFEDKNIQYKYSNKVTLNYNQWKLSTTNDDNPYIINLSALYSNINNTINYYSFPVSNYSLSGIIYNKSLILPINENNILKYRKLERNKKFDLKLYKNAIELWFTTIKNELSIEDLVSNDSVWENVYNEECMHKHVLYNNLSCDKFGIFARVNVNNIVNFNDVVKCKNLHIFKDTDESVDYNCYVGSIKSVQYNNLMNINSFNNYYQNQNDLQYVTNNHNGQNIQKYKLSYIDNDIDFINTENLDNNIHIENDVILENDNINGNIIKLNQSYNKWYKIKRDKKYENFIANNQQLIDNNVIIEGYERLSYSEKQILLNNLNNVLIIKDYLYYSHKSTNIKYGLSGVIQKNDNFKSLTDILNDELYDVYLKNSFIQCNQSNVINSNSELTFSDNRYEYVGFNKDNNLITYDYFIKENKNSNLYFIYLNAYDFDKFNKNDIQTCAFSLDNNENLELYRKIETEYKLYLLDCGKDINDKDKTDDINHKYLSIYNYYEITDVSDFNIDIKKYDYEKYTNITYKNVVFLPVIKLTVDNVKIYNRCIKDKISNIYSENIDIDSNQEYVIPDYNMYLVYEDDKLNLENDKTVMFGKLIDTLNLFNDNNAKENQDYIMNQYVRNAYDNYKEYLYDENLYNINNAIKLTNEEIKSLKREYIKYTLEFLLNYAFYNYTIIDSGDSPYVNCSKTLYNSIYNSTIDADEEIEVIYSLKNLMNNTLYSWYVIMKNILMNIFINTNNEEYYNNVYINGILTQDEIIRSIGTYNYQLHIDNIYTYDEIINNLVDILYEKMQMVEYSDNIYKFINSYIDIYNDTVENEYRINHLEFYKSYNINTVDYSYDSIEYNDKLYGAIFIDINISLSDISFNISESNTYFNIFNKINNTDINNENIYKYFKYIYPFLNINIFNMFINNFKRNVCLPRNIEIFPNKQTKEINITDSIKNTYYDSLNCDESSSIYNTYDINGYIKPIYLNRYFSHISPLFKQVSGNVYTYCLKFRDKNEILNEDNLYYDKLSLNNAIQLHYYSQNKLTNNVETYILNQIEEKSFNYNSYYLIPFEIIIEINKKLTYKELLEYENEKIVKQEFIKYIDKNTNKYIDNEDIKLFLYNKYKVNFLSNVIGKDFTNSKIYSLKYQFIMYND